MEKTYDHKKVEEKIYKLWEEGGYFRPKSDSEPDFEGESYTIPIPPPNVTGKLHVGHAYILAIEDAMIRFNRMNGKNALWIPGTDHAGIATQNVVEKKLRAEGKSRHSLGREAFIEEVWKWKDEYHKNITSQIRAMGSSCDWSRERFTLDEGLSRAVKKAFVTLYDRGLIYKGEYMINWCPRCQTVLADDEVDHEDKSGQLWHFKYPLEDNSGFIIVATTRPETMLGDTAVAVNPKDKRFADFVGKYLILPIIGRKIPIISDNHVDIEFGTGAVKVTPAHDPNDYEMGQKHNLPTIKVISEDGNMTVETGDYAGTDRYEARAAIVEEMDKLGLLEKTTPHNHAVGHCYRCNTVIEPMLSDQWFVKSTILSQKAIESLEKGELEILPKRFNKVYTDWLNNMRDWCISRQLWWGHQIPAWYCIDCGETIVDEKTPQSCPKCKKANLKQDEDVLDTWFSSALWPFSILGWPEKTPDFNKFYPTSMLETAYDILFFWVARMTMMGVELTGTSPFKTVYLNGLIRDEKGRKMSKSIGNVVEPISIIDEFGADSLRFTYLVGASPGTDINLSIDKIKANRNFNNKIWNISRYISSDSNINEYIELVIKTDNDKWIVSELQKLILKTTKNMENYKFSLAGEDLHSFIWNNFADWYLELSKTNKNPTVLYYVLENILKLMHPFNPFITEHLWDLLGYKEKYKTLLITADWPKYEDKLVDNSAEKRINSVIDIIKGARSFKKDQGIENTTKIEAINIKTSNINLTESLQKNAQAMKKMAGINEIIINGEKESKISYSPSTDTVCFVTLGDAAEADLSKIADKYKAELEMIKNRVTQINHKLTNNAFINNAPKNIIERENKTLKELQERESKITSILEKL